MNVFQDLLVLECATVLAGPAVGAFFAELGATVIKIEPLNGDVTRCWKLPSEDPQETVSAYFTSVNWGKYSLALDLKSAQGQAIAQQLARQADIVVANYKPGAAEKLGMGPEQLRALNPTLIYAHLTGYGSDDPRTGYDALIQAESGFLGLNGHPGQPPAKMPVALMDLLAAHQLKEAILVALLQRQGQGKAAYPGAYLEVSLLQSALASLANQASNWLVGHHKPQALGLEHPNIVPYGTLYPTQDGHEIMLAIGSDRQFAKLCQVLNQPKLAQDPRFASNAERVRHRGALHQHLRPLIAQFPAQELLEHLWRAELPAGQVNSVPDALSLPAAQGLILQSPDGRLRGLRSAVFKHLHTGTSPLPPPSLGADSQYVLQHFLKLTSSEVNTLAQTGVIGLKGGLKDEDTDFSPEKL